MAKADDVAAYILAKSGRMTAMKLQKLLYYSQAWHLVWDEEALFPERIEAWANGPVCPVVWTHHRGRFILQAPWRFGDATKLTEGQRQSVDAVIEFYGDKSAQWLSDLTHSERPWREAREGLGPDERGGRVITHGAMADYYAGLSVVASEGS